MYGTWGAAARAIDPEGPAFDIPMQGMGLFAFKKSSWPGVNPRFAGFGAEEGYVHEKFRQAGGRTLCLPFLRWLHRFNRPMGTPYPVNWDDRVRNYLIGRDELGLDSDDVVEHFSEHIGEKNTQAIVARVNAEMENPFYYFDAIYCMVDENYLEARAATQRAFAEYGIANRVIAILLSDFSEKANLARILACRDIIYAAKQGAYKNVLIFDGALPEGIKIDEAFAQEVAELGQGDWSIFCSGAGLVAADAETDDEESNTIRCLGFHHDVYTQIMEELPQQEETAQRWLEKNLNLAAYCIRRQNEGAK